MKLYMCSATKTLVLGLYDDEKDIDFIYHLGNNDHSKNMMRLLDELLKRNGVTLKNIDEIVVSNGPGSYTGVRIAVVIAKTLACFNHIKLSKVHTLETLISTKKGIVAPYINARNGYVFGGVYQVDKRIKNIVPDAFITVEKFDQLVKENKAKKVGEEDLKVNVHILNKEAADVYSLSPDYLRKWTD